MPDPATILGPSTILVGAGVYVKQDLLLRLLGPTFHYLGDELQQFVEKRKEKVGKIFLNAEKKLGSKLDNPGQVSPKVLRTILNEGSFSDNEITVEYFGGVLASSRSEIGRDDRGARIAKMIDNMSAYQLRTHFLIYSTISELFCSKENSFNMSEDRREMQVFFPLEVYIEAMAFTLQEWNNLQILNHIFHGLSSDGLIEDHWGFGNRKALATIASNVPGDGIVCTPTAQGEELFLWAFGYGDRDLNFLLTDRVVTEIEGIPSSIPNAVATKDLAGEST